MDNGLYISGPEPLKIGESTVEPYSIVGIGHKNNVLSNGKRTREQEIYIFNKEGNPQNIALSQHSPSINSDVKKEAQNNAYSQSKTLDLKNNAGEKKEELKKLDEKNLHQIVDLNESRNIKPIMKKHNEKLLSIENDVKEISWDKNLSWDQIKEFLNDPRNSNNYQNLKRRELGAASYNGVNQTITAGADREQLVEGNINGLSARYTTLENEDNIVQFNRESDRTERVMQNIEQNAALKKKEPKNSYRFLKINKT